LKRGEFQPKVTNVALSFEQQKELLTMQLEHEKLKQQKELEQMKFKTEQTKLELEQYYLDLIKEGKLNDIAGRDSVGSSELFPRCDVSTKLRLVPKFNEKDLDTFFSCLSGF